MKWLYHRIRRFFLPHLYWTQKDLDEVKLKAKQFKEFFGEQKP